MEAVVCPLLTVYWVILLVRAIFSWIPVRSDGLLATVQGLAFTLTEPVLAPLRNVIPPVGGFDLSFLVLIFGLQILQSAIC